jgi:hypothetical protein
MGRRTSCPPVVRRPSVGHTGGPRRRRMCGPSGVGSGRSPTGAARSSPSTSSRHSPVRTRKSSCADSAW